MLVVYGFRINDPNEVKLSNLNIYSDNTGYIAGLECGWIPFLGRAIISDNDKELVDKLTDIKQRSFFLVLSKVE